MKVLVYASMLGGLLASSALGQLVFSAPSGGGLSGLFQQSAGSVSAISSGLSDNVFPSTSRDGRLVVLPSPDPAQPSQPSTDLWLVDRVAQTRSRIVNNTTTNLPDGSTVTLNPQFNQLHPGNGVVAVTDQILINNASGSSVTPNLTLYRVSDGFILHNVELGRGDASDLFRAEFVGITWKPDGSGFATPAYATYTAQSGAPRDLVGIILYSFNPVSGTAARQSVLSFPRSFDLQPGLPSETHIFPAFSPDGTRLAYFEIFWPNPLLTQPATTSLLVANANGTGIVRLQNLGSQTYPLGLAWSPDGSQLIYSIATQVSGGGTFIAAGDPSTAVIRSVSSFTPGAAATTLAGVNAGYFPNMPPNPIMNTISLTIEPFTSSNLLLRCTGLPGSALYGLQSATHPDFFGARQNFSGAQFNAGIIVTPNSDVRLFRLVE